MNQRNLFMKQIGRDDELYGRGSSLKKARVFDEAKECFTALLRQTDKKEYMAGACFHLGEIALLKDCEKKARTLFLQTLEHNPFHRKAQGYLKQQGVNNVGYTLKPFCDNEHGVPTLDNPVTQICTENQCRESIYKEICKELQIKPAYKRKIWEFAYIIQVLKSTGVLGKGKRGVGFGVGNEPLPALFARYGCTVLATDLAPQNAVVKGWMFPQQQVERIKRLNKDALCPPELFASNVSWMHVDMNDIPAELLTGQFDFVWSTCALEHLGSIEQGKQFILQSLACLRPGGVAVHTTEYNISSNTDTIDNQGTVLFRRTDIGDLVKQVSEQGYDMVFNPHYGDGPLDLDYDVPPYGHNAHLKLLLDRYIISSIGISIKGSE